MFAQPPSATWPASPAALAEVARAIRVAAVVGFDCEFASAERMRPVWCLTQVVWRDRAGRVGAAVVDMQAGDPSPVLHALCEAPRVIAHAPRQDLGLFWHRLGRAPAHLIDLQLAAAFAGLGDQLSLGKLCEAVGGPVLDKGPQWSDWERRPLGEAQRRYAELDVAYLLPIYDILWTRLEAAKRTAWVTAESEAIGRDAAQASAASPDDAWRDISAIRSLDGLARSVAIALAGWRARVADELNKPLSHVLDERVLIDLARARFDVGTVAAHRGVRSIARDRAADMVEIAHDAIRQPAPPPAPAERPGPPSPRAALWAELVLAMIAAAAQAHGIPARLIGARASAESFARAADAADGRPPTGHPLAQGWRADVVGHDLAAWFMGERALIVDPDSGQGLALTARPVAAPAAQPATPRKRAAPSAAAKPRRATTAGTAPKAGAAATRRPTVKRSRKPT